MILTDNIKHQYDVWQGDEKFKRTALDGVSLDVKEGEFIAILGANGSGKSTLAKHLNVLLLPDEGAVWVDGKDTSDESNLWAIRTTVGMVFQNPDNQIVGTSVEEDVAFGPENKNMESVSCSDRIYCKLSFVNSKCKLWIAPPSTLGHAALALHYANVIILIEKLILSPHLIGLDTRDDLYDMLPTTIRKALRARLKSYTKTMASTVYDAALAAEWSLALVRILDWLAPLAHNMVRWHSERNFEKQQAYCRTNVLLVQTLYFANQAKTEAAITELLVGLNYICRIGREVNDKDLHESSGSSACSDNMLKSDGIAYDVL